MIEVMEKLNGTILKEFDINRMDDFSVLLTKIVKCTIYALTEDEETQLRNSFDFVSLWHKEYGLRFSKRYELFGIPLHLLNDANIKKNL